MENYNVYESHKGEIPVVPEWIKELVEEELFSSSFDIGVVYDTTVMPKEYFETVVLSSIKRVIIDTVRMTRTRNADGGDVDLVQSFIQALGYAYWLTGQQSDYKKLFDVLEWTKVDV